ncbi:hypothetical protein [Chryseobacterium indoltheticum]|uniref:Uncharacterized protein n=1 Tax=Chryseobacterium indoltheticum TaxID=254 RepID=A0A381F4D3_9FLAO|nr:hypothetical protein [Chryseobacterium indoltheticum]AZA74962.1 hypothetical protein EG358_14840 [Chryseobacterium indoltheticum]SIQ60804.1 hypothetical protein SAMN05421682_106227 [Chryseobacterium indoltheticum]SUX41416.1 Uncharacterised protein [Chryseobacterium indoltheticum]
MEKIKEFLSFLFEREQVAIDYGNRKDDFEKYNVIAKEIKSYMSDITVGFGVPVLEKPAPDFFYDEGAPYPTPRHLYKISHYQNKDYGDLWACYVSIANPYNNITGIDDCFIVTEINGELKIVAKFGPDIDQPKWKFYGGDRELKINKLGKLLSIERIMEPIDDAWSMEQYNKEI